MRTHKLNIDNLQKKGISLCEEWVKKNCLDILKEPNVYIYEPSYQWEFDQLVVRLSQGGWSAGYAMNFRFITRCKRTACEAIRGVLDKEIERRIAFVKRLQEIRRTLDKAE